MFMFQKPQSIIGWLAGIALPCPSLATSSTITGHPYLSVLL
ncbi:MAG: hypothetical protein ACREOZ_01100 [Gloeomargaritales cyanobacterium]